MLLAPTPISPSSPPSSGPDICVFAPSLERLARYWPLVEPILKRATDRSASYEPIDILQRVMTGQMAMWVITEDDKIVAVAVTEVKQLPRNRVLLVPFIAGRGLKRWHEQLLAALDAQALAAGCTDIHGWDRKGWSQFGFRVTGVTLQRSVGGKT